MVVTASIVVCLFSALMMLYVLAASARNEVDLIDSHRAVQRAKAEYAERNRLAAEIQALNNGSGPSARAA